MSVAIRGSSLSPYLYHLEPNKYGNQQEDYLQRAEEAIQSATKILLNQKETSQLSEQTFLEVQKYLAEIRREIAKIHQTKNAEDFGAPRIVQEGRSPPQTYICLITPCGPPYDKDGLRLIREFQPKLKQMNYTLKKFPDEQVIESEENVLGRKFKCITEVFSTQKLDKIGWFEPVSKEKLQQVLGVKKEPIEICADKELMQSLKKDHLELYERINSHAIIYAINRSFPGPQDNGSAERRKSLYTRVTLRCEINKKMYAIGKVFTWMYQTHEDDPVERMREPCDELGPKSIPVIVHQDPFLIEDTMKELGKMFLDILSWNRETNTFKELQQKIALFRYVYGFCAPCFRGDGAIGDWLEIAFYRFHGFQNTRHNPECLPCFELFSLSFSNYLKRYPFTIIVE